VFEQYSDSYAKTDSMLCLGKTNGHFRRHTSAVSPNLVERVGLARTGGKQAILKRADHRFIEREFVSHIGYTSLPRVRVSREYHECRAAARVSAFYSLVHERLIVVR
jgi:hypothetical protein